MRSPHSRREFRSLFLAAVALLGAHGSGVRGDDAAVVARLDALGRDAAFVAENAGGALRLREIAIADGSALTAEDIAAFGGLVELGKLQIHNCRDLDDAAVQSLLNLQRLHTLAITNSGITDEAVAAIVQAFPDLVDLDLSSNTNLTGTALRSIATLTKLERLNLMQCRFSDLHTRRLAKLPELRSLDLRGNMEAGDRTMQVVGALPHLAALKHRSSTVTDEGLRSLADSPALESLLMQDFAVTSASGLHLARLTTLKSLEIFRCQGFGTEGVLALADLPLARLTLRDLPDVDDAAIAVLGKLPRLKRLYLHELASVGDAGLAALEKCPDLEVLDIWSLPQMTDATVGVIAGLANLKELTIRETGVTEAAVDRILALPKLESLTFKDNGRLSAATAAKLAARRWKKLDLGAATDE
jgi:F-box/leucine-rich repeat protein 14